MKGGEWIFAALVAASGAALAAKGSISLHSGVFETSARGIGRYEITGRAGELMGLTHVLLGAFLIVALAAWATHRRAIAAISIATLLGSLASFVASLIAR